MALMPSGSQGVRHSGPQLSGHLAVPDVWSIRLQGRVARGGQGSRLFGGLKIGPCEGHAPAPGPDRRLRRWTCLNGKSERRRDAGPLNPPGSGVNREAPALPGRLRITMDVTGAADIAREGRLRDLAFRLRLRSGSGNRPRHPVYYTPRRPKGPERALQVVYTPSRIAVSRGTSGIWAAGTHYNSTGAICPGLGFRPQGHHRNELSPVNARNLRAQVINYD